MKKLSLLGLVLMLVWTTDSFAQTEKMCWTTFSENSPAKKVFDTAGTRGMADKDKRWDNGQVLLVKFMNGSQYLRNKVMDYAKSWEQYANIKFQVVTSGASHIRVQFDPDLGSYSSVGTDALDVDQSEHTMNLGIDSLTDENYIRRVSMHEFGHTLGLHHEHMSPISGIKWNKAAVYKYYIDTAKWDKAKIDYNMFYTLNISYTNGTSYDPYSIMHYPLPRHFTTNGFGVDWNTFLSEGDKAIIGKLYPKIPADYNYSLKAYCSNFCSAPAARIDSGLVIYPIMNVQNAALKDVQVLVYFSDENRIPIKDVNGAYVDRANGQICTPRKLPMSYLNSYPVNQGSEWEFGVFIPYKELQLKKGTNNLKYDVKVYTKSGNNWYLMYESKYYDISIVAR